MFKYLVNKFVKIVQSSYVKSVLLIYDVKALPVSKKDFSFLFNVNRLHAISEARLNGAIIQQNHHYINSCIPLFASATQTRGSAMSFNHFYLFLYNINTSAQII